MAKVIDFDRKFMEYADGWLAMHPSLTPKQAEESYNKIMLDWLNAPAKWLSGETPGTYFAKFSDPGELVDLVRQYDTSSIGLPEPLYRRIVDLGESCVPAILAAMRSKKNRESVKESLMGMLVDIDSDASLPLCVEIILAMETPSEITEMAADMLSRRGGEYIGQLLDAYDRVSDIAQLMIIEIGSKYPGDERLYNHAVEQFTAHPDRAAICASFLADIGDARAIETLRKVIAMSEIGYLDYIEIKNAIESLGGEASDERTFDGDPDYEAMKYMQ